MEKTFSNGKYIFSILEIESYEYPIVIISSTSYWIENKHLPIEYEDREMDELLPQIEYLGLFEVDCPAFEAPGYLSLSELNDKMLEIGFRIDIEFNDYVNKNFEINETI